MISFVAKLDKVRTSLKTRKRENTFCRFVYRQIIISSLTFIFCLNNSYYITFITFIKTVTRGD